MNHRTRFISEHTDPAVRFILVLHQARWHTATTMEILENLTLFYLPLPLFQPLGANRVVGDERLGHECDPLAEDVTARKAP